LRDEAYGNPNKIGGEQVERCERQRDQRRNDRRPAPADAVGPPAPAASRQERAKIGEENRRRHQPRRQVQILLQMRREQRIDRVESDEAAGQPHAGAQRIAENVSLEDGDERRPNLPLLEALTAAVLQPDRRLLDELAYIKNGKRRQNTDPQHAAP